MSRKFAKNSKNFFDRSRFSIQKQESKGIIKEISKPKCKKSKDYCHCRTTPSHTAKDRQKAQKKHRQHEKCRKKARCFVNEWDPHVAKRQRGKKEQKKDVFWHKKRCRIR